MPYSTTARLVPGDPTQVVFMTGIIDTSIPPLSRLLRNVIYCDGPISIRKMNASELDWYWAHISWDIDDPILVIENDSHTVMMDLEADGSIRYADLLDGLEWP